MPLFEFLSKEKKALMGAIRIASMAKKWSGVSTLVPLVLNWM
jgi:hypothetical protein